MNKGIRAVLPVLGTLELVILAGYLTSAISAFTGGPPDAAKYAFRGSAILIFALITLIGLAVLVFMKEGASRLMYAYLILAQVPVVLMVEFLLSPFYAGVDTILWLVAMAWITLCGIGLILRLKGYPSKRER